MVEARLTCKYRWSIERRLKQRSKEKQAVERVACMQEKWWQVLEKKRDCNKTSISRGHFSQGRADLTTTVLSALLVSAILPRGFLPVVSHVNLRTNVNQSPSRCTGIELSDCTYP